MPGDFARFHRSGVALSKGKPQKEHYPYSFMRSFASQSHTRWYCRYHVVIVPKYRKRILFGQTRVQIGKILRELAKQKESEIIESHAHTDHIHMLISIPPKCSVAHVMGFLKGKSAIRSRSRYSRARDI